MAIPIVTVGQIVTYTITFTFSGKTQAQNVILLDTISEGTTFKTDSITIEGILLPNIATTSFTFTVVTTIPNDRSRKGISNVVNTIVNNASLGGIVKLVDKIFANYGDTINILNSGNVIATNVVFKNGCVR